ncbi:hypothetical protein SAMD00023353_6200450 [Rosellinia necatrix]|uniref:Cytochrome oxidase c assembly domain-containing protein n=1 Tax=Rosellinia necatrix TaxID=77044 RepID=A0A1W2TSF2_ROSNE|nr:hypothetical protein SAMD00023353_6200450 [Rosellinia necatrix]
MAASNSSPRSVADATRFTSNTPHANRKSSPAGAGRPLSSPNTSSQSPSSASSSSALPRRGGGMGPIPQETMEERVRRLRAAHLAAKQHDVSKMDKIIGNSRRIFDAAHKFTVMGLIGFSGLALLVTVYATADMMVYNRKRRNEFFALQKQLKEDSLEAARLAYMTGTASEEQVALVEEATARAEETGIALPSILSAPQAAAPAGGYTTPTTTTTTTTTTTATPETRKSGGGGLSGWLFGGLKKEETTDTFGPGDERWKTDAGAGVGALRDTAKAAFEQERDSQRRGGPLDQVGLDPAADADAEGKKKKKKGWGW